VSFRKTAMLETLEAWREPAAGIRKRAHRVSFDYEPRPGYLYVRSRAISSRVNDNHDGFPADEIEKSYKTFLGKPVFVNHRNANHRRARGVIVAVALHRDKNPDGSPDTWVEALHEIDATRFPKLAKAILEGRVNRTSMGVDCDYSTCSACGNKATSPAEYCQHLPGKKGMKIRQRDPDGKVRERLVHEICAGLTFFENSFLVEDPADPSAHVLGKPDSRGLSMAAARRTARREFDDLEPHEQDAVSLYHRQMIEDGVSDKSETPRDYLYEPRREPKADFIGRYMDGDEEFKREYGRGPADWEAHHQDTVARHPIPGYPAEGRWPLIVNDANPNYIDDGYHRMHSYMRDGAQEIPTVRMHPRTAASDVDLPDEQCPNCGSPRVRGRRMSEVARCQDCGHQYNPLTGHPVSDETAAVADAANANHEEYEEKRKAGNDLFAHFTDHPTHPLPGWQEGPDLMRRRRMEDLQPSAGLPESMYRSDSANWRKMHEHRRNKAVQNWPGYEDVDPSPPGDRSRLSSLRRTAITGESAEPGDDVFATPRGGSPVARHAEEAMEGGARSRFREGPRAPHPFLSAPDHGPYYVTRDPAGEKGQSHSERERNATYNVLDREGRSVHPFGHGHSGSMGMWSGWHGAMDDWYRLTHHQDPEEMRYGDRRNPTAVDGVSMNQMHREHLRAHPPQFPHSRVDPSHEEALRRPDARVAEPSGHSPSEEWHGPYEVVRHPQTGKFHVVDNAGRHAGESRGRDTHLQAELTRDYVDRHQQSKEEARNLFGRLSEDIDQIQDPGSTPESRQSDSNLSSGQDLMTRYEGGAGKVKFDSDEEGGEPYYEREHHLRGGAPSGWTARHYGGPHVQIHHRATGDEGHDVFTLDTDEHGGIGAYGDADLGVDLKRWHDEIGGMREHLETEEPRYGGDARIQRWKKRRLGSRRQASAPLPPGFSDNPTACINCGVGLRKPMDAPKSMGDWPNLKMPYLCNDCAIGHVGSESDFGKPASLDITDPGGMGTRRNTERLMKKVIPNGLGRHWSADDAIPSSESSLRRQAEKPERQDFFEPRKLPDDANSDPWRRISVDEQHRRDKDFRRQLASVFTPAGPHHLMTETGHRVRLLIGSRGEAVVHINHENNPDPYDHVRLDLGDDPDQYFPELTRRMRQPETMRAMHEMMGGRHESQWPDDPLRAEGSSSWARLRRAIGRLRRQAQDSESPLSDLMRHLAGAHGMDEGSVLAEMHENGFRPPDHGSFEEALGSMQRSHLGSHGGRYQSTVGRNPHAHVFDDPLTTRSFTPLPPSQSSLRRTAGDPPVRMPSPVDTLRPDTCPVCGDSDVFKGQRCPVCGFVAPPDIFRDPDVDQARMNHQELEEGKVPLGMPEGPADEEMIGSGQDADDQMLHPDQIAPDGVPGVQPENGEEDAEQGILGGGEEAGDGEPELGPDGQPLPPDPDDLGDGDELDESGDPVDPDDLDENGEPIDPQGDEAAEEEELAQGGMPPMSQGGGDGMAMAGPEGEEPGPDDEDPDDEEDEDDDAPPRKGQDGKREGAKMAKQEPQQRTAATVALAAQQRVISAQAAQIRTLTGQVGVLSGQMQFLAELAGVGPQLAEIRKRADVMNPAQPVPDPPEAAPTETTEQTLAPETMGDVSRPGTEPGSTTRVPAAQTTTAITPGVEMQTAPATQLVDVSAPVTGTNPSQDGGVPLSQRRIETDVRIDPDPLKASGPGIGGQGNDGTAYPWVIAARQAAGLQATASRPSPQDEQGARTFAAIRLARLRVTAGIARGDELEVGAQIEASAARLSEIEAEIDTLGRVSKAAALRQPRAMPRQGARSAPSMAGYPAPAMAMTASRSGYSDDDSDVFL
jgi:hypothetical protein